MSNQAVKEFNGSLKSSMIKAEKYLSSQSEITEDSSNYEQGRRGLGHLFFSFIVALIIGLVLLVVGFPVIVSPIAIGIITILVFMKKPAGKLTVSYKQTDKLKTCPKCAEEVKEAATVCRYCDYNFQSSASIPAHASEVAE